MKSLLNTPDIEPIKDADFLFGVWPWARGPMWELQEPMVMMEPPRPCPALKAPQGPMA